MRFFIKALTIAMIVSVGGCGKFAMIDYYGDSTAFGVDALAYDAGKGITPVHDNPPDVLARVLKKRLGYNFYVNRKGVPGARAAELLMGNSPAFKTSFEQDMKKSLASVVIINFGINDAFWGVPPDKFASTIKSLVEIARANGKDVILETSNPVIEGYQRVATGESKRLAEIVQSELNLAKQLNVPIVDQYNWLINDPGLKSKLVDGVHPSNALYQDKSYRVMEAVKPLFKPARFYIF